MAHEKIRRVVAENSQVSENEPVTESRWWDFYAKRLAVSGLTETSISVVDIDSDYIVNQGLFGAGEPETGRWPKTRLRRGLVMGAVQSGKTGSMIGVITKALDRGVNVVVILAGTRLALWRQTYERVLTQLDGWSEISDPERRKQRILLPRPALLNFAESSAELSDLYFETPNLTRRMLSEGRPLVAVVMKHSAHLMQFRKYLHRVIEDTFERSEKSLHMLVIDDEADDGSILDSEIEAGLAPDAEGLKQMPRHIARLWSGHKALTETAHERLYATYLAYTATPQANFLQADHNPLSPSDFLAALRTPLDEGTILPPRSTTYDEPVGLANYYCGGELFYRRLNGQSGGLCEARAFPNPSDFDSQEEFAEAVSQVRAELLSDALRAYFVSGAIRLLLSKKRLSIAKSEGPNTKKFIQGISPEPHSMLFHPSASVDMHFAAAEEIVAWSEKHISSSTGTVGAPSIATQFKLSSAGLIARLAAEEELWRSWVTHFEATRNQISFLPGGFIFETVNQQNWDEIRRILIEEVFPNVKLSVINSDPRADDRPRFHPIKIAEDKFLAAPDIYTIFVSGNVMARGITIEGLVTTLFLRTANEPVADTQMQMQRWFGYRGRQLCWCRVFLFRDQLDLFRAYHESDEAVRREIIGEMNKNPVASVNPMVLQGMAFRATGKIANLRALPLCPGADPFVSVIETGHFAPHNIEVLTDLLHDERWEDLDVGGVVRGKSMVRQLGLLEVAALLERFRYSDHDPSPHGANHDRWRALASEVGLSDPDAPLFRPPGHLVASTERVAPPDCPYSIAAYLRLWNALLSRRARGIYPTDNRQVPWSMIDLAQYAKDVPEFYVGIRYGSAGLANDRKLSSRGVHCMKRDSRDGILVSTWGSRNPGVGADAYLGDQLFDYHVHHSPLPVTTPNEPTWRPRGAPGLVLFHVIRAQDGHDAVTVGLALPLGGPDHIAALRPA